jgi:hypothetical protein
VRVTVGDADVTADMLWAESSFTMAAKSATGNFHIALRGERGGEMGAVVTLEVDGQRQFGGLLMRIVQERFQPDVDEARQYKTILEGPDFNVILDRLIIHNPDTKLITGTTAEEYRPIQPSNFPAGTTDAGALDIIFNRYLTSKPEWFHIGGLQSSAIVSTDKQLLKLGDPRQNYRDILMEFVRLTDSVFWIDPHGGLWYCPRGSGPGGGGSLSKGGSGGAGARSLEVTSSITNAVAVATVWGCIAKPVAGKVVDTGRIYGHQMTAGTGIPLWMQVGEYNGNTMHTEGHVIERATAIVNRRGKVIWTAQARTTEIGFMVGGTVSVDGAGENLTIKQVTVGFYIGGGDQAVVYWDISAGVLPDDPWKPYDFIPYPNA